MNASRVDTAAPVGLGTRLPFARHALAVISHPGDESCYLGAVLSRLRKDGARISVLSLTRGEAAPCNASLERAGVVRPFELQMAGFMLAMTHVTIADLPDGMLGDLPMRRVTELIRREAAQIGADLLLTVDRGTEGPDNGITVEATRLAARALGVNALAWTEGPGDVEVPAERDLQRCAIRAHHSQRERYDARLARLAEQGDRDSLRWLHRAAS
ncbi:PIG-L family deacetylase [Thermopolyspora sp. NPDC052614]|uniref:PIG-L deacetylase family protein n=1 Tax=Thermopolyspora sp. NPDC052614 TaxID=3155682 RepID=UPI003427F382